MWRKTDEGKPSSQGPETTLPAPGNPKVTPTGVPNQAPISSYSPQASAPSNSNASVIIPGLKIHGEISGSADLIIDGEVEGSVRMSGAKVTVGPNGKVRADIEARAIHVEGNVRGNLHASEGIFLGARGTTRGSLIAPRLGIEDGARVSGKVDMRKPGESRNDTGSAKKSESVTIRRVPVGAAEESETK
jgi:cytoskeletal protein CcmA (bactofilin family)